MMIRTQWLPKVTMEMACDGAGTESKILYLIAISNFQAKEGNGLLKV